MEETLEGGRGPPRAVAPLEREREYCCQNTQITQHQSARNVTHCPQIAQSSRISTDGTYNYSNGVDYGFCFYGILSKRCSNLLQFLLRYWYQLLPVRLQYLHCIDDPSFRILRPRRTNTFWSSPFLLAAATLTTHIRTGPHRNGLYMTGLYLWYMLPRCELQSRCGSLLENHFLTSFIRLMWNVRPGSKGNQGGRWPRTFIQQRSHCMDLHPIQWKHDAFVRRKLCHH